GHELRGTASRRQAASFALHDARPAGDFHDVDRRDADVLAESVSRARSLRLEPLLSATRVVATLGPASEDPAVLKRMMEAGAAVFRFNLSHGAIEQHIVNIAKVRRVAAESGRLAGVLVDLPGPKIRTAANQGGARIPLPSGAVVGVTGRGRLSTPERIVIRFPRIARALGKGDSILLDDGALVLRVLRKVP